MGAGSLVGRWCQGAEKREGRVRQGIKKNQQNMGLLICLSQWATGVQSTGDSLRNHAELHGSNHFKTIPLKMRSWTFYPRTTSSIGWGLHPRRVSSSVLSTLKLGLPQLQKKAQGRKVERHPEHSYTGMELLSTAALKSSGLRRWDALHIKNLLQESSGFESYLISHRDKTGDSREKREAAHRQNFGTPRKGQTVNRAEGESG